MGGIVGSFASLRALKKQIDGMKSPAFNDALGKRLGAVAIRLVADEFRAESDPYGRAWKKLSYRKGKILQLTGRLKNSFHSKPAPGGFTIGTNVAYAAPHQEGGSPGKTRPPQRMMIPTPEKGMPQKWARPLKVEADRFLEFWFKPVKASK